MITKKNIKTNGSVYMYTMFFVIAMFSMLMLLLRVSLNNSVPVFTNLNTINLYHVARSGVDLFVHQLKFDRYLQSFNRNFKDMYYVNVTLVANNRIMSTSRRIGYSQTITIYAYFYIYRYYDEYFDKYRETIRIINMYQPLQ